jgi:hypothetical protein
MPTVPGGRRARARSGEDHRTPKIGIPKGKGTNADLHSRVSTWCEKLVIPEGLPERITVIAVTLIGFIVLMRAQGRFGFYEDEGINLLKAMMVAEGHSLYRDIYSDQAPLHTDLLAMMMDLFGPTLVTGRALALAAGTATLSLACAIAARLAGPLAACLCALSLLACAPFLKFATSTLITTPAIALSLAALYCLLRGGSSTRRRWWVAGGLLMGLALMTKLAVIYFLPILVTAALAGPTGKDAPPGRAAAACWGTFALLAVVLTVVALHAPGQAWSQLVRPHAVAWEVDVRHTSAVRRLMLLAPGMFLFYGGVVLATASTLWRDRSREPWIVVAWLLVVGLWILNHRPLWAHHLPDLILPMAVALALGTARAFTRFVEGSRRSAGIEAGLLAAFTGLIVVVQLRSHDYWRRWYNNTTDAALAGVSEVIARNSSVQDWVIVDRPMLAFLARRRTPPELVLIGHKRIVSGGLTDQDLLDSLERYRPAIVAVCTKLLTEGHPRFVRAVEQGYETVAQVRTPATYPGHPARGCHVVRRRPSGPLR